MPERIERLKARIEELEQELAALPEVDAQTRSLLEQAVHDIQAVIDQHPEQESRRRSVLQRLHEAAEQLETSHPTLFGVVTRVADALGQIGI